MKEREEVLRQIAKIQEDTASVTVQIGGTDSDNMVEHDTLYLLDCPPKIVSELEGMGFSLRVSEGRVQVLDYSR